MNKARLLLQFLLGTIAAVTLTGAAVSIFRSDISTLPIIILPALFVLTMLAPLINILHRSAFRMGGLALCGLFLLVLAGVILATANWLEAQKVWESAAILFFYGLLIGIALLFKAKPWAKFFAPVLTIICSITALLLLILVWTSQDEGAFSNCLFNFTAYTIPATLLLLNAGRGDKRYFRWPGIVLALAAGVLGIIAATTDSDRKANIEFSANLIAVLVNTLTLINLILMTNRPGLVRLFQRFSILFTILSGIGGTLLLITQFLDSKDIFKLEELSNWLIRSSCASLFLTIGAILCLITARQILRVKSIPISPANITTLLFTCPSCNVASTGPLRGACPHCLLQFRVTLIEPHCPQCDHILLNLTSDRCPECGHPIERPVHPPAALQTDLPFPQN